MTSGRARCAAGAAALACGVMLLSVSFAFDEAISDAIYGVAGSWPVTHEHGPLRLVFYDGPTRALGLFAIWLALGAVRPALVRPLGLNRREALYVLACLLATPLLIGTLKYLSGVSCAYELVRYGGALDDVLGHFPFTHTGPGRCWPAAHPSGMFALFCLGALPRSRRVRRTLWLVVLVAGTALGTYQVMRGAHFVSHVVITALIAQSLVCALALAMLPRPQAAMTSSPPI